MRVYSVDASLCLCFGCGWCVNEAMACPPTHGLCLTSLSVCSYPLQANWTPLHRAAQEDASATAAVLIKSKANLEAKDEVGGMVLGAMSLRCGLNFGIN